MGVYQALSRTYAPATPGPLTHGNTCSSRELSQPPAYHCKCVVLTQRTLRKMALLTKTTFQVAPFQSTAMRSTALIALQIARFHSVILSKLR